MNKLFGLITLGALTSCASSDENARSLLDRLEWDEDEVGCMELRGTVDLNPLPLFATNVSLIVKKQKGDGEFAC